MKINKLLKALAVLTIGTLLMGMMVGCGKQYIVMGTNAEFEPFEYREGTEIVGFDVEIAEAVAEKLGKELKIEDMEFDSLIAQLNAGRLDFVASGMTIKPAREKQVDFSDSYFTSKQVIIVKEENEDIKVGEDLKGKSVGVQLGTTGEEYISEEEDVECIPFNKGTLAVMDLVNGKIDAVVIDEEPAKRMVAAQKGLKVLEAPFVEEKYAIAVKKGDVELKEAIDETLAELQSSGKYDEMYAKYFAE
ncbi:basic amino acid ABC transporter substrate-binding protein [Cellulosilyticum ruminicola]|uniref:basic amino acid ABC transporter substrate-binding protein n=1 Tax=Cellulosilyticum ruminicola TaxID=425254 RepID=UPI0006D0508A|nr:basic amino acid ABC transporter substrate-binding protein [Cellulosilyticum ruminicola]